jgi:bis(5'-nucleosyl)-tetraphosphatase (symmetrical)
MSRLIIYGDIHGCYDELVQLRQKINPAKEDVEVCVGDVITRGKNSIKTLRYLQVNNIKSVLGNHEDKIVRYLQHQENIKKNPIVLDEDEQDIVLNLSALDIDYLKNMPLFMQFGEIKTSPTQTSTSSFAGFIFCLNCTNVSHTNPAKGLPTMTQKTKD